MQWAPAASPRLAFWRDPLPWACGALAGLLLALPHSQALFAALFPALDRPLYEQDAWWALFTAHVALVALSSAAAALLGIAAAVFVTRPVGREFRPLVDTLVAVGQTVPPVAVLAIAVPLIGFGALPAFIALALYGLLPIVRAAVAGLQAVPAAALEAAQGMGMTAGQRLRHVELPLALPVLLAGLRSSVVINIGTATIASTVGAKTLGSPIIVGLSGFNTAYVLQGALVVGLLAVVTDLWFQRLQQRLQRWKGA